MQEIYEFDVCDDEQTRLKGVDGRGRQLGTVWDGMMGGIWEAEQRDTYEPKKARVLSLEFMVYVVEDDERPCGGRVADVGSVFGTIDKRSRKKSESYL